MNNLAFPIDKFLALDKERQELILQLIETLREDEKAMNRMVTTDEAAGMLRMTRSGVVKKFNKGELKGIKLGKKILIYANSVKKLLNS